MGRRTVRGLKLENTIFREKSFSQGHEKKKSLEVSRVYIIPADGHHSRKYSYSLNRLSQ